MIRRPNTVAVGTIVWLGSEVMFFAGLFAIYFTLRSMSGDLFATEAEKLNVLFATINTTILLLSSFSAFSTSRRVALDFGGWNTIDERLLTAMLARLDERIDALSHAA